MATVRVLDRGEFADLLDKLCSIEWPVPSDQLTALVRNWGWTIHWADDDTGKVVAIPSYAPGSGAFADFTPHRQQLATVSVDTSEYVDQPTEDSRAALQDGFAQHVAIAAERLGAPAQRSQGEVASAKWDLPSGATLLIARGPENTWIELASPKTAQDFRASAD